MAFVTTVKVASPAYGTTASAAMNTPVTNGKPAGGALVIFVVQRL